MTDRNRAWRRRQERLISWKGEELQRAVASQFQDPNAKPLAAVKQHQHGKLTHVQDLRLTYSLDGQAADGYDSV